MTPTGRIGYSQPALQFMRQSEQAARMVAEMRASIIKQARQEGRTVVEIDDEIHIGPAPNE